MQRPPADIQQQAARNAAVSALAAQQLAGLWPQVDWASPDALQAVKTVYRAVVRRFGQASAAVAADFYDRRRAATAPGSTFRAVPADPVPDTVLNNVVDNAFKGAPNTEVVENPETTSELPVSQRVPARLDNSVGRHVAQAGRDTIVANAAGDPVKPRYIRVPTGQKTCAFCVLLASRELGPNFTGYATERNALFRSDGHRYHDHCDCEAVPVFPGDDQLVLSPNLADYQDMYYKAAADAGTHRDARKILASMRTLHDLK